jgi:hypothetical protein
MARIPAIAAALGAGWLALPSQQAEPADLAFRNGQVYTANTRQARVQAVAVKGNKIV